MAAGGQLLLTTTVENFPGFPEGVYGSELMDRMRKQAEKFGVRFIDDDASAVDFGTKPLKVTASGQTFEALSVIISARWLGIPSEKKFIGRGVSSCATCDGAFFKNKNVIVVGGGDTAMEDAIFLTQFANSVTVVHRRDSLRASKIMQERAFANPKIKFIWNSVVDEVLGESKVTGVKLKDVQTGALKEMPIDGVFVAIGYDPNTSIFKGAVEVDEQGYIKATDEVKTSVEGVFVAGDVADKLYRQAITAAGSGAKAALEARAYILRKKYEESKPKG